MENQKIFKTILRFFVFICFSIFYFFSIDSVFTLPLQNVIENPSKPLNRDSGRVVTLREIMRIQDDGNKFFFRWPGFPKTATNSMIFVKARDQFLQFDGQGNFLRNLFKKGQGPKEMMFVGNYYPIKENLLVHSTSPRKIIWFDYEGNVEKEVGIATKNLWLNFLFFYKGHYYFILQETAMPEKREEVLDIRQELISFEEDGQTINSHAAFTTKQYIKLGNEGGRVFAGITNMLTSLGQDRYVFIAHTSEYLVKMFDAESQSLIRSFRRDYQRVKATDEDRKTGASIDGEMVLMPPQKYKNDIQNLHVSNDKLFVVTSTSDKKKGLLIDVFDFKGNYVDMFYLQGPEDLIKSYLNPYNAYVTDGYLYAIINEEDGAVFLIKYELENI